MRIVLVKGSMYVRYSMSPSEAALWRSCHSFAQHIIMSY